LDYLQKALALARESKDQRLEGKALSNLAQAYAQAGQTQLAIETHQQSISLLRAAGLPAEAAWEINNMAALYYDLGDRDKALALLNEALPLLRAAGDRAGQARVLSSLGKASFDVGDHRRALEIFQQAKALAEGVGDRQVIAAIHNGLGLTYQALGQAQPALENYLSALRLSREVHDPVRETNTLVNLGRFSIATNQLAEGAQFFQLAMQRGRAIGDTFIEAMALGGLAVIERQRGNLDEARRNIEAAVRLFEARRVQVVSQDLRASFFATVQDYYQLQIDVLMRLHKERPNQGFDALALQASEQGRARSLLETLAEANADIRQGVDPQLVERERSLQKQLNTAAQTQQKILSSNHAEQQAAAIAQEIQRLTTDLQQVQAQIRQKSPSYASLTQPQPLSLKEIQTQVLDDDTVLLEYSLGEERSYMWLVTPSSISSYELPPRKEIETAARELYELLNRPEQWSSLDLLEGLRQLEREPKARPTQTPDGTKRAVPDVATRLSRTLLAPVLSRIAGKRLLIVADGALQYVPFGALSSPESDDYRPLIIDHEIVSSPSASTVAVLRQEVKGRRPADKSVAVLADPVFEASDERVKSRNSSEATTSTALRTPQSNVPITLKRSAMEAGLRGGSQIDRLPGTRNEAQQIMALVPPDQGKQALDFLANRETATSAELSRYQYVHFATHGFLNSVHPELSGIVLSLIDEKGQIQDGFLRAHEIYNLKLPAELVVLSACQTGLGKEIKGEGLVGLTRGFMYAGAPRVVVSLWSVNDAATAELMSRFYRGMLRDKLKPAAALRAAQVSLIKEKQWQAPFFWAAFTLQGEWR
jgi:CHAT domain-containing protein